MRTLLAAGVIAAAAATSACGEERSEDNGPTVSRAYQVGDFKTIELAGRYDVDVRTGAQPSVTARGPEKLIERLEVEVRGNQLEIRARKKKGWFNWGWNGGGDKVQITVTVPQLEGATLAGSGTINVDKVTGERFEGDIAGSGDLRLGAIDVGLLKLGIAGSGGLTGTGKARSAEFDIAGSGEVNADSIVVENLKVSIAGSGDVRAHATRTADVDIMGSGDVAVRGGAKCSVNKAGSGDVRCS